MFGLTLKVKFEDEEVVKKIHLMKSKDIELARQYAKEER